MSKADVDNTEDIIMKMVCNFLLIPPDEREELSKNSAEIVANSRRLKELQERSEQLHYAIVTFHSFSKFREDFEECRSEALKRIADYTKVKGVMYNMTLEGKTVFRF